MKNAKINSLVLLSTFAFSFAGCNAVCAAGNITKVNEDVSLIELPSNDGGNSAACLEEKTVMGQPDDDDTLPVRSAEKTGTECSTADTGQPSKSSHLVNHPAKTAGKNRKKQVKQSRGTGPIAGCLEASVAAGSVGAISSGLINTIGKTPKQTPEIPKENAQAMQKLKEELEQLKKRKEELEKQISKMSGYITSTVILAFLSIVLVAAIVAAIIKLEFTSASLTRINDDLTTQKESQNTELEAQKKKIEELKEKIEELNKRIDEQNEENKKNNEQMRKQEEDLSSLQGKYNSTRTERSKDADLINEQRGNIEKLSNNLKEEKDSKAKMKLALEQEKLARENLKKNCNRMF